MTLAEHLEKVIIPAIQSGKTEHSVILLLALTARTYRAGLDACNDLNDLGISPQQLLTEYISKGWSNE